MSYYDRTLLKCPAFLSGNIWNSTSIWERLIYAWVRLKDEESSSVFRVRRDFSASCRWRIGASGRESFGCLLWPVRWNRTTRTCCSVAALLSLHPPHHHPWGERENETNLSFLLSRLHFFQSKRFAGSLSVKRKSKWMWFSHINPCKRFRVQTCVNWSFWLSHSCHTNARKHYVFCIIDFFHGYGNYRCPSL